MAQQQNLQAFTQKKKIQTDIHTIETYLFMKAVFKNHRKQHNPTLPKPVNGF